jgi:outer membrane protein OmpA-like peptidoglycan-associated protein
MSVKVSLSTAVAAVLAFGCVSANADNNNLKKETKVGMATGAAMGAVVGGPIGAAVGFMVGSIVGDSVGTVNVAEKHAKSIEAELADVRLALSQAQAQAASEPMFSDLAQRLHGDVMFRTNSAELSEQAAATLKQLGQVMSNYPGIEIELHGFADPRGKGNANLLLSQARAETVREALINGGAKAEQIRLAAHGADLATAQSGDTEAYAWERRVSIAIASKQSGAVAQAR